jgi:hypothetical protein
MDPKLERFLGHMLRRILADEKYLAFNDPRFAAAPADDRADEFHVCRGRRDAEALCRAAADSWPRATSLCVADFCLEPQPRLTAGAEVRSRAVGRGQDLIGARHLVGTYERP